MANYDDSSIESIFDYANKLTYKSLSETIALPVDVIDPQSKGQLGNLVETYYFGISQNNKSRPDFHKVDVELKTTGLLKRKGTYVAKERLVLSMINYSEIVNETFEGSSLLKKCQKILLMFYLWEQTTPAYDRKFVLPPILFEIPENDFAVISKDWHLIQDKIRQGRAHELSEGDTNFLGACTKGGDSADRVRQPNSQELAKPRAFSLKHSYMKNLVAQHLANGNSGYVNQFENYEDRLPNTDCAVLTIAKSAERTFDELIEDAFSKNLGLSVADLSTKYGVDKTNINEKGFHRRLANAVIAETGSAASDLRKAGIEMKTIRLQPSGKPRESMSFPNFSYLKIVEEEWEDSDFNERLERKFLLVVFFQNKCGVERLEKVSFWNMPYLDRMEAKRVWEETKRRVQIDANDLPRTKESYVAHVRPKARRATDTELTPQGEYAVKKCFWLNSSYIASVVRDL